MESRTVTYSYADKPRATEGFQSAIRETGADIMAFFIDSDDDAGLVPVMVHKNMMATMLIGQSVVNDNYKKIATVQDIIITPNGKAALIVVAGNGFLGLGKKVAAFDYNRVVTRRHNGHIVMVISQDMMRRAVDFSYDSKDYERSNIIPAGSVSTNTLLNGDVLDHKGVKMANVENVYFRPADLTQIIVGFHKTPGVVGGLAAFDYDAPRIIQKNEKVDFQLTSNQAAYFKCWD